VVQIHSPRPFVFNQIMYWPCAKNRPAGFNPVTHHANKKNLRVSAFKT